MMRRPNRFSEISLAQPEVMQANFAPPTPMQIETPPMQAPDTGGQIAGLGETLLLGLKKRQGFQGHQKDAIMEALGKDGGGMG